MSYLIFRNGAYWFQMRVPKPLVGRFGPLIRQNLQTSDPTEAKPLALQLGGYWLQRFAAAREGADTPALLPVDGTGLSKDASAEADSTAGSPTAAAQKGSAASVGFDDSIDGLVRYWQQTNPHCTASTYAEVRSIAREFRKVVGKRPSTLQRTDIAAYRDHLIGKRRHRATVGKKVGFISTLLQTAYDAGYLPQNVARGLKVPRAKVADAGRRGFTDDELRRIFSSPVYSDRRRPRAGGGEAAAWVPLLALATGARLEEICQLRVDDIREDTVHGPLMHISDAHRDQRLKTTSSRRDVPLHPEVVAAGLLTYRNEVAHQGHQWLFPALDPDHDGRRGGNLGKWFARYLRSRAGCFILDPAVVFHSFRHTFKSLCRAAGMPEEVHDALTGHAGSTVGRGYGEVPLATRVDAIRQLQFPIELPRIYP